MKEIFTICDAAAASARATGVVPALHLDDFILQFLLNHPGFQSTESAVEYYFSDGKKSAEKLRTLLADLGVAPEFTLLEFASGYGCVTRHLCLAMPGASLLSCDIHDRAIEFITLKIGVNAVISDRNPSALDLGRQFDVVFALSFFSHMPERTWGPWVSALYDHVRPGGVMIFTTHGEVSRQHFGNPEIPASGFWFRPDSEQKDLDVADYGQTIVTSDYVKREVKRSVGRPLERHAEGFWWEHQDLYVLRKPEGQEDSPRHADSGIRRFAKRVGASVERLVGPLRTNR